MKDIEGQMYMMPNGNIAPCPYADDCSNFPAGSTNQLCDIAGCERKTLYKIIDTLEVSGFGIEIIRTYQHNEYKLRGVY